jgi:hypothetical protein
VIHWGAGASSDVNDPPPLKWSDLKYVFDTQEDHDGEDALQA